LIIDYCISPPPSLPYTIDRVWLCVSLNGHELTQIDGSRCCGGSKSCGRISIKFSGCITFGTRKNDEVLGPHNPDYGHELIQIDGSRCWGWLRFFAADEISSWLLSGHYTRLTILDRDYRPHRQITGVEITPCHLRGIPFIECPPSLL